MQAENLVAERTNHLATADVKDDGFLNGSSHYFSCSFRNDTVTGAGLASRSVGVMRLTSV